jgi:hypothetical protein
MLDEYLTHDNDLVCCLSFHRHHDLQLTVLLLAILLCLGQMFPLLNSRSNVLLNSRSNGLLNSRSNVLLNSRSNGLLNYRSNGLLNSRSKGLLNSRSKCIMLFHTTGLVAAKDI